MVVVVVASVVGALGDAACAHRGLCLSTRAGPFLANAGLAPQLRVRKVMGGWPPS